MATQAQQYHHPLPSPPEQAQLQYYHPAQQSQDPEQPPKSPPKNYPQAYRQNQARSRAFSFHSDKSRRSSTGKADIQESHAEKDSRRLHSKADPTLAISEAEPSVVAATMTQSAVAPLRSMQHKDSFGNPIADPDKSNPTRNRWERPLDTIRSFEAAIDGSYSRKSLYRAATENDSVAAWNRRSSFQPQAAQPRFRHESYYGSRPVSYRPESNQYDSAGPATARNSYYDGQGMAGGYQNGGYQNGGYQNGGYQNGGYGQPPPGRQMRMQSDPHYQLHGRDQQNIYPLPHKDRSYETVTSAAASGNSDPAGYQTDPTSSDNSSIDRRSPAKRQEPINDYGIGFSQPQMYQPQSFTVGVRPDAKHPLPPMPGGPSQQQGPPPVPRKEPQSVLRRQRTTEQRPEMPEKRKSWFTRRFSKNS